MLITNIGKALLSKTYLSLRVIQERPQRSSKSKRSVGASCTPTDLSAFCCYRCLIQQNREYTSQHKNLSSSASEEEPLLRHLQVYSSWDLTLYALTFLLWCHCNLFNNEILFTADDDDSPTIQHLFQLKIGISQSLANVTVYREFVCII